MKILVTGSSGFLGHAIRQDLIKRGYETYGTTRSRPPEDAREFRFDIVKDSCEKVFDNINFDIIIHAIGLVDDNARFKRLKQTNVNGTKQILNYAKKTNCKHFIQLSSVSVYGIKTLGQNRIEKSLKIQPHSLVSKYGRSKAQAECEVLRSGVPYTILRLPIMFGKGDSMISLPLINLLHNKLIHFRGKGEKLISIMPINNLCELISVLIERPAFNQSFHCPSYQIPLNLFVNEHSYLTNLPYQVKRSSLFWLFLRKRNTITKILFSYSWRGAHFQDTLIRSLLPEYMDIITWKDAIGEVVCKVDSKTIPIVPLPFN
jgi:nucleoside-diphosphate-sugar epimerase